MADDDPVGPDIERAIDEIYQAPFAEFIERRNRLAGELRKAGDAEGAERVKGLTKPSQSAWAVNQLFWHGREAFDELIAQGDRSRRAQQVLLAGGDSKKLQDATTGRQEALSQALRRLDELTKTAGTPLGSSLRDRAATTLEALAAFGSARQPPMDGRLATDLDPPGLAALASLVSADSPLKLVERKAPAPSGDAPSAASNAPTGPSPSQERRLAKARDAVARAQSELEHARAGAERATTAEAQAREKHEALQDQISELQSRLTALEREASRVEADWQRTRIAEGRAQADLKKANTALESARESLGELMDEE